MEETQVTFAVVPDLINNGKHAVVVRAVVSKLKFTVVGNLTKAQAQHVAEELRRAAKRTDYPPEKGRLQAFDVLISVKFRVGYTDDDDLTETDVEKDIKRELPEFMERVTGGNVAKNKTFKPETIVVVDKSLDAETPYDESDSKSLSRLIAIGEYTVS